LGINLQIIILKTKKTIMKKLFAIALIAVSFAACNSGETSTEGAEATADSLNAQVEAVADSAQATIDSAAATVDSAAAAAVDSLKK
jgi:cell shape-determining protein MreC